MLGHYPNIIGTIAKYVSVNRGVSEGSFSVDNFSVEALNGHASGNVYSNRIQFSADKNQSIYGMTDKVQMSAFQTFTIIKI